MAPFRLPSFNHPSSAHEIFPLFEGEKFLFSLFMGKNSARVSRHFALFAIKRGCWAKCGKCDREIRFRSSLSSWDPPSSFPLHHLATKGGFFSHTFLTFCTFSQEKKGPKGIFGEDEGGTKCIIKAMNPNIAGNERRRETLATGIIEGEEWMPSAREQDGIKLKPSDIFESLLRAMIQH